MTLKELYDFNVREFPLSREKAMEIYKQIIEKLKNEGDDYRSGSHGIPDQNSC